MLVRLCVWVVMSVLGRCGLSEGDHGIDGMEAVGTAGIH